MRTFVIATTSTWFSEEDLYGFSEDISWNFFTSPEELTREKLLGLQPEKIFFLHWNQKIPEDIFGSSESIIFHTAPLPIGRGGSPIQNLIEQGYTPAPLNALRVVEELDAGPIYARTEIDLTGSLKVIFDRIRLASIELLDIIITENPVPSEQEGAPLFFRGEPPKKVDSTATRPSKLCTTKFGWSITRAIRGPSFNLTGSS